MPYVANPRRGPVGVPCNIHGCHDCKDEENVKHFLKPFHSEGLLSPGIPKKAHTNITHMFNKVNNQT